MSEENNITRDERKANLAQAVSREVAAGWRVESQSDYQAVVVRGGNTNHVLHLVLSLVTCGVWLLVWPVIALINQRKTLILQVDEYGNVLRQAS